VHTAQPGVQVHDDCNGFGQQLTGTGTLVLADAEVDDEDVAPFEGRFRYQTALYQLVLLAVHAGIAAADREANALAEIRTAQAQVVLSESVPRAATLLFNTLGASGTSRAKDLDRHWRNARTVASHNPVIYKARIVGDWSVNGTVPPYVWEIGTHASVAVPETAAASTGG
jgi:alkylation response protein AidB-like acyl-CoA dehydrogenase